MEIEFVVGEWTCKSSFLFFTVGTLVCPEILMALLTGLCALRGHTTLHLLPAEDPQRTLLSVVLVLRAR